MLLRLALAASHRTVERARYALRRSGAQRALRRGKARPGVAGATGIAPAVGAQRSRILVPAGRWRQRRTPEAGLEH